MFLNADKRQAGLRSNVSIVAVSFLTFRDTVEI